MPHQTILPVSAPDERGFDTFHGDGNAELLARLRGLVSEPDGVRVLYFWGEGGSGKTHLLHACCHLAHAHGAPHAYLSAARSPLPGGLDDIPPDALVCVDDLQAAATADEWLRALLGVYERVRGVGAMLVAADQPPAGLRLVLRDLESRIASGGVHRLRRLSERERLAALQAHAQRRGFELNAAVLQFISTHCHRDPASLFALLERIDAASLAQQRRVTVPFVKSLL